ncbi:MAG: HTH domain-containing protein, partial [Clostridia bacterium]|nr:HTH domain-containing protein [Clostridia bacterium]
MKYRIMIKMLTLLMSRRKVTAKEIADRFDISVRSVYRYVEELNVAGVPVDVVRGRYGGIFIADTFRLPSGYFTRGEYAATVNALTAMLSTVDDEDVTSALEKLQR